MVEDGDRCRRALLRKAVVHPRLPLYVAAVTNLENVGDRLLLEAHQKLMGVDLGWLPLGGNNRLARLRVRLSSQTRVVLGGGTLIGRPSYRQALEAARSLSSSCLMTMLAVGVSAPTEAGKSSWGELAKWSPTLREMPHVRVRGPRSQQYLAELEIESEVVGDPVIALFWDELGGSAPSRTVIGINPAVVPDWALHEADLLACVVDLARRSSIDELVVLEAAPYDRPASDRAVTQLSAAGIPVTLKCCWKLDVDSLKSLFRSFSLVLAVRLHIMVLSASCGVPYVALSYEDKCDDFQESIDNEASTLLLRNVKMGSLLELAESNLSAGYTAEVARRIRELALGLQTQGRAARSEIRG